MFESCSKAGCVAYQLRQSCAFFLAELVRPNKPDFGGAMLKPAGRMLLTLRWRGAVGAHPLGGVQFRSLAESGNCCRLGRLPKEDAGLGDFHACLAVCGRGFAVAVRVDKLAKVESAEAGGGERRMRREQPASASGRLGCRALSLKASSAWQKYRTSLTD